MDRYEPTEIEPKWQRVWADARAFNVPNPEPGAGGDEKHWYQLEMLPYPSANSLHMGHVFNYTMGDVVTHYHRRNGARVLRPMGWDAFGLPAEQYAIKSGQHPAITTRENIAKFKTQLKRIGFSYDWSREISTADPKFYRWTQWIFLQIYNSWFNPETNKAEPISTFRGNDPDSVRLAYVAEVPVNWCPDLGTVLANEEVIDGKSEVGGFPVVRRPMRQWMLRITAFADRLLQELEGLDWPAGIKLLQRNWIGKSEGAEIDFKIDKHEQKIRVFTTRPDTLYGGTFLVLAPEHPLIDLIVTNEQWPAIREYREKTARKSDLERAELTKEKTGVFTGAQAINPANEQKIPIWIADYVLLGYGTGAIGGVPAHDERDLEFAKKFDLPIVEVVQPLDNEPAFGFVGEGMAINSPIIDGLTTAEAKKKITKWLEERGQGKGAINYKLRDWLFSRQRYWGEPFPIFWENGRHHSLSESELPLVPPELEDYKPTGTGEPPLAKAKDWIRYSDKATRETNTMPQWAGSCWYYLRFCDPVNESRFVGEEAERYWMGGKQAGGVDLYVGGTEHAVLHLLYARFWHKVLFDLGHVSKPEPFQRLVNQGIILGEDNRKMSKRWGNVIDPLDVIAEYGADAFRCYEMFMGPLEQMKPWSMKGVEGLSRFLARVWRLLMGENQTGEWELSSRVQDVAPEKSQRKILHATIKKVTEDIESLSFNTAISQMMVFVNAFINAPSVPVSAIRTFLILLSPFAPHIASELWENMGEKFAVTPADLTDQAWPEHDERLLVEDEVEIIVQVNGKVRDRFRAPLGANEEELKATAQGLPKMQELLAGKQIAKVVVVPNKLVNLVTN
jgi:leucyl-tRNA synthetase